jgi:hypothetical protein
MLKNIMHKYLSFQNVKKEEVPLFGEMKGTKIVNSK